MLPQFRSFQKSGSSAFRYIWMACECLGPRGDEKNGCRDVWVAYCDMHGKQSKITGFKENRFNNLFQAAASLHYHRSDISDCLSKFLLNRNKKLESVMADCSSEEIDHHLIAIGLLYFWITGPYWSLLSSPMHYLEFFQHVEKMQMVMHQWQQDASPAFRQWSCIFTGVTFQHDAEVLRSLQDLDAGVRSRVQVLLQKICSGLLAVTERQLQDFLPGGRYNDVVDPAKWEKIAHSKLTNLVGEECFGDLDFSIFKRRSSSLHHHSTINILKQNKSVSQWLLHKPSTEQEQLLQLSASKSQDMRQQHKAAEKEALQRKQAMMLDQQHKEMAVREKRRQVIQRIMSLLKPHHGPCAAPGEVQALIEHYTTKGALKSALKAELQYQKVVLQVKSPFLRVSGNVLALANSLLCFLGGKPLENLPPVGPGEAPSAKRRKVREFEDSDLEESSSSASETDSSIESSFEQSAHPSPFHFTRVGDVTLTIMLVR